VDLNDNQPLARLIGGWFQVKEVGGCLLCMGEVIGRERTW